MWNLLGDVLFYLFEPLVDAIVWIVRRVFRAITALVRGGQYYPR